MEIEEAEQKAPKFELDLDMMAQQVQNLFNFRNFYVLMDLTAEQRLAITKAIIEVTDLSGGSNLVQKLPCGGAKIEGWSFQEIQANRT